MSALENTSVKRVRAALVAAGLDDRVMELADTARSAQDAAASIGTELGSIVKSLVFRVGERPVMALVAGDRQCREKHLKQVLDLPGKVRRADADTVRAATGYAIGGVSPAGLPGELPVVVDASLARFATVYAAAGHPHCVFPATFDELVALSGGLVDDAISHCP
ncbi:MAG: YbaK/EbsC family protein [Hyphomicrobiales bacterium]|nr:YbaK/EbsC family protein [Hyphomicrobiales bacterium]